MRKGTMTQNKAEKKETRGRKKGQKDRKPRRRTFRLPVEPLKTLYTPAARVLNNVTVEIQGIQVSIGEVIRDEVAAQNKFYLSRTRKLRKQRKENRSQAQIEASQRNLEKAKRALEEKRKQKGT